MAFYLLNCSVDFSPLPSNDLYKIANFNEQESLIEIVVEQFLGYDQAFAELAADDLEQQTAKKSPIVSFYILSNRANLQNPKLIFQEKQSIIWKDQHWDLLNLEIPSPPPKV